MNKRSSILTALLSLLGMAVHAVEMSDSGTPPGQLYDGGGYDLHMYCEGQGGPAVILDAGLGGFSLEWVSVQRLLSDEIQVCAYDRAGYGWSDPGPAPRTTDQIVGELHTLLGQASLAPPYILVGHSFGGYNMQYYAKRFPAEAAGMVLVDSSHPEQADRLPEIPALREKSKASNLVTFYRGQSTFQYYPEDILSRLMWVLSQHKTYVTQQRESMNFAVSGEQVLRAGPLPDIPLIVVTRGKRVWPEDPYGDMLEATWHELQRDLARQVLSGRQIIAKESDHLVHLEQPDVVALAIRSVLDEVLARKSGTPIRSDD